MQVDDPARGFQVARPRGRKGGLVDPIEPSEPRPGGGLAQRDQQRRQNE